MGRERGEETVVEYHGTYNLQDPWPHRAYNLVGKQSIIQMIMGCYGLYGSQPLSEYETLEDFPQEEWIELTKVGRKVWLLGQNE